MVLKYTSKPRKPIYSGSLQPYVGNQYIARKYNRNEELILVSAEIGKLWCKKNAKGTIYQIMGSLTDNIDKTVLRVMVKRLIKEGLIDIDPESFVIDYKIVLTLKGINVLHSLRYLLDDDTKFVKVVHDYDEKMGLTQLYQESKL